MKELQELVIANSTRWFPTLVEQNKMFRLMYHSLGLAEEAGEVAGKAKKLARTYIRKGLGAVFPAEECAVEECKNDVCTLPDDAQLVRDLKAAMATELADVFAYLCNVADVLGVDLEAEYRAKAEFNNTREWAGGAG